MDNFKITTANAPEASQQKLYEVLKAGKAGAIPVEMDGQIRSAMIMIKDDLSRNDMIHFSQMMEADVAGNAFMYPFHIREVIGRLINPWAKIQLWKQMTDRSRERVWDGVAKDLPKEFRECYVTEFLSGKKNMDPELIHLAITMEG